MNIFQLLGINTSDLFGSLLIFLAIFLLFFLIVREIVTWYWKINEIVELLERIEKNTRPKFVESVETPKVIPVEGGFFTDHQPKN